MRQVEDTIGAIAEMVEAGYVKNIGLSEVSAGTLRRAQLCTDVRRHLSAC
jgi:aryl-alcohol dehydrogenase-like predicted oxidoreductase